MIAGVYPRLRGGSDARYIFWAAHRGLSPPTRGIRCALHLLGGAQGSIPAYAGDPRMQPAVLARGSVYPRLRGGSTFPRLFGIRIAGLSPPTRGIRLCWRQGSGAGGSIPAYAGDPAHTCPCQREPKVYPRLRGGSSARRRPHSPYTGLSPPTRGIQCPRSQANETRRSIPAYAGDPPRRARRAKTLTVYPRLRGGSAVSDQPAWVVVGLSPPTRGIPLAAPAALKP